jgi:hypothetical protein
LKTREFTYFSKTSTQIAMTDNILARALGCGIEKAAALSYSELEELLTSRESISGEVFDNKTNDSATYEILADQLLDDFRGKCIEVRVMASDGIED